MKKVINENTIKSIVRESLRNYLRESMDMNNSEGWTPDMDDMWNEFGNNNINDTDGAFGVLAQGDDDDHVGRVARSLRSTKFDTDANMGAYDDEADEFASDDNAEYLRDKMFESIINRAVNEAFKKAMNDDNYDFQDKSRWCGNAKFHAENERKAKEKAAKKKNVDEGFFGNVFGGKKQTPTQNVQQRPTQQRQQPQEDVRALMQGAKDYAKEIKLWQKGMGGYNAVEALKNQCQRICNVTGQNPNQLYKDIMASVYV